MSDRLYNVQTQKFGTIVLTAANIAEARKEAKKRFKVGPQGVTAVSSYRPCQACECSPCCCGGKS